MVAFSLYQNLLIYEGIDLLLKNLCSMKVDGARPRSLPAGGYEPPCHPHYTIKQSTFTPTLYNPNLVSLMKQTLSCWEDWKRDLSDRYIMLDGARPRSLPTGGYEPPCGQTLYVKRSIFSPAAIQNWYRLPSKFGIIVFGPFSCI